VAICLHVTLSFCLQAHPCRHSLEKLIAGGHIYSDFVHRVRYIVLTLLILGSAYIIAFFVSDLGKVFIYFLLSLSFPFCGSSVLCSPSSLLSFVPHSFRSLRLLERQDPP
jgi:hypothetical protein